MKYPKEWNPIAQSSVSLYSKIYKKQILKTSQ